MAPACAPTAPEASIWPRAFWWLDPLVVWISDSGSLHAVHNIMMYQYVSWPRFVTIGNMLVVTIVCQARWSKRNSRMNALCSWQNPFCPTITFAWSISNPIFGLHSASAWGTVSRSWSVSDVNLLEIHCGQGRWQCRCFWPDFCFIIFHNGFPNNERKPIAYSI